MTTRVPYSMTDAPVNLLAYGAVPGGANCSAALAAAFASGATRIYVPAGTFNLSAVVSVTLSRSVVLFGEGALAWSGTATTLPMLTISTGNNSLTVEGLSFDGNNLAVGGLRVTNSATPSSDTLPTCTIRGCAFIDFRMTVASPWNIGAYVEGSYDVVTVEGNTVRNITRAAGTGTPGSSGTLGIAVQPYDATKWVRSCVHLGNSYANISGDDALGSANNVDHDAFMFFAPDPSNFSGQYPLATVMSRGNTYRNARGRAVKIQATGVVADETIIRDSGYSNYGGSVEINFQWGVGTVRNCSFFYRPYAAGASSPLQSPLTLVSFYQGADYGEDTGSAVVDGLHVYNSIGASVGSKISVLVGATVGSSVADTAKPLVSIANVSVNKNAVDWIAAIGYEGTCYGTLRLDNIVVPGLTNAAVATNGTDTNFDIVATNVVNIDGLATPANAKPFVTDTLGAGVNYGGMVSGALCQGFLQTYSAGGDNNKAPTLNGAALTSHTGFGGALSVQSVALADDASHTFARRFYAAGRGLIAVSVNYDYTSQGIFAIGSDGVYQIAAHGSDVFTPSTTGSNIDTDGQLNLWFTGGALRVKNRLGDGYVVTVAFLG